MSPVRRASVQKKKIPARLYTIAWFCVTQEEAALARACLDHLHEPPDFSGPSDGYYTYGEIQGHHGIHNIVIIKSAGSGKVAMGTASAKGPLEASFPNLRLAFVVGIAAGLPTGNPPKDIYKGDVVVATPLHGHDAVIEYDYAELHDDYSFQPKHHTDKTALQLRNCFDRWHENFLDDDTTSHDILKSLIERNQSFRAPEPHEDVLFLPENVHVNPSTSVRDCAGCRESYQDRRLRPTQHAGGCYPLNVHRGQVLTGSSLIKSADARERIFQSFPEALCVDMESAVLMDTWHPLIVRGISDYGDSHYDWKWTQYASATASAVAKSIIQTMRVSESLVAQEVSFMPVVRPESATGEGSNVSSSPPSTAPRPSTESEASQPSSAVSVTTTASTERATEVEEHTSVNPVAHERTNTNDASSSRLLQLSESTEWTRSAVALIENGADVTLKDEHGNTALHYAVGHDNTTLAKALIARSPTLVVQKNHQGQTPLHVCVMDLNQHSLAHAKRLLLVSRGKSWFDPDARDGPYNGKTVLEHTIAKYPTDHSKSLLRQLLRVGASWPNSGRSVCRDYVEIRAEYERNYYGRRP
jgi:nucleoside phosphorylase